MQTVNARGAAPSAFVYVDLVETFSDSSKKKKKRYKMTLVLLLSGPTRNLKFHFLLNYMTLEGEESGCFFFFKFNSYKSKNTCFPDERVWLFCPLPFSHHFCKDNSYLSYTLHCSPGNYFNCFWHTPWCICCSYFCYAEFSWTF